MFSHILVAERRNRMNLIGQYFFDWSVFYFKKFATENSVLLLGCKIPLARSASVLHAQIVCSLENFLRCCLVLFYGIVFSLIVVFVVC